MSCLATTSSLHVAIDDEGDSNQKDDQPIELALINLNARLEKAEKELNFNE